MGMSTDITGYGLEDVGATLEKVTDRSRSPQPGSARVEVGVEDVVSIGSMVDGCKEDGEDGVAGNWASVSRSAAAPSMIISSSMSDMVRQG